MTLDMIFLLLCDRKLLRATRSQRVVSMTSDEAVSLVDPKTGLARGRTADGKEFQAAMTGGGDSLAGRLIAAELERDKQTAERAQRRQGRIQQRKDRKKSEQQRGN